jgi:hypothetical protein
MAQSQYGSAWPRRAGPRVESGPGAFLAGRYNVPVAKLGQPSETKKFLRFIDQSIFCFLLKTVLRIHNI